MTSPHDERWTDAVGVYLLGAMPAQEEADFEVHLDACPECRQEVEYLRVAAEALPASPMQFEPPPELKDRIMAVVYAEAELLRAAGPSADRAAQASPRRRRLGFLRRGTWSLRPSLALAGAVAVLVVGVLAGVLISSSGDSSRTVVADLAPAGAKAELIIRRAGHSTLVTSHMPAPGANRVYQVWLKRGTHAPEPTTALFNVRKDGSGSTDVPGDLDDVDAVLVTSEPDGGSPAPTRPPVLSFVPA